MHRLRSLVFANRPFACAVFALALMMKIVMPAGFMPSVSNGKIVVSICSGTGPMTVVMTVPGSEHGKPGERQHGKAEQPCAFAGLSSPSLAAADPVVLALAILFAMALALRPMAARTATAPPYLRPPLRGPPARL